MAKKHSQRQGNILTKRLLDSNIIIYASKPENESLRNTIRQDWCYVLVVSKIEVLGYHNLEEQEHRKLADFFAIAPLIKLSEDITNRSINVRKAHNLSLGDSSIAATALEYDLPLSTRNTKDFESVADLQLFNPFDE